MKASEKHTPVLHWNRSRYVDYHMTLEGKVDAKLVLYMMNQNHKENRDPERIFVHVQNDLFFVKIFVWARTEHLLLGYKSK